MWNESAVGWMPESTRGRAAGTSDMPAILPGGRPTLPGTPWTPRASYGVARKGRLLAYDDGERVNRDRGATDKAMEELYHACYRRLVAQVYAFTTDLTEAPDVVQEAFARALAPRRGLNDVDNPEAG